MGKRGWILTAVLLVVVAAGGFWYWQIKVKGSPSYALHQAAEAAENHDLQQFKKYVDVEGVSERLVDDVVSQATEQTTASSAAERLGQNLGRGLAELMKPRLAEEVQDGIERFVETGEVAGGLGDRVAVSPDSLAQVFQGIQGTEINGSMALVRLRIQDMRADSLATVELRMREMDGYWQVAEIANASALLAETESESESEVSTVVLARKASMKSDLRNLATTQEVYFAQHQEYASSLSRLDDFYPSSGVEITIRSGTEDGWSATADHQGVAGEEDCGIARGEAEFPTEYIRGDVEDTDTDYPACR